MYILNKLRRHNKEVNYFFPWPFFPNIFQTNFVETCSVLYRHIYVSNPLKLDIYIITNFHISDVTLSFKIHI